MNIREINKKVSNASLNSFELPCNKEPPLRRVLFRNRFFSASFSLLHFPSIVTRRVFQWEDAVGKVGSLRPNTTMAAPGQSTKVNKYNITKFLKYYRRSEF